MLTADSSTVKYCVILVHKFILSVTKYMILVYENVYVVRLSVRSNMLTRINCKIKKKKI